MTDTDKLFDLQKERVTSATARNWMGRLIGFLSKRDNDDFTRINAKLGDATIIRYFAGRYMDPFFATTREEAAYRKFGETIESAYHTMIAELTTAREADKASKMNGWAEPR